MCTRLLFLSCLVFSALQTIAKPPTVLGAYTQLSTVERCRKNTLVCGLSLCALISGK